MLLWGKILAGEAKSSNKLETVRQPNSDYLILNLQDTLESGLSAWRIFFPHIYIITVGISHIAESKKREEA